MIPTSDRRFARALFGAILLAFALQIAAYWPGVMPHDAVTQYYQVASGRFDDWHPPAFAWLWRKLRIFNDGPAPILVLQAGLYWFGFCLLAASANRRRRNGLALALATCGLMPIAYGLMGAVLKDSLLAATLIAATGLLAWGQRTARILALALLLFAATLRFNAFLAALPLLVALLPAAWRRTRARLALVSIVAALPLLLAGPLVSRAVHAEKSGVERSLILFDLGGITEFSGVDVFPPMPIVDIVAANHRCYTPLWWDAYARWGTPPCPINFDSFGAAVAASDKSLYRWWLDAVLHHPLAYAEHRLAHLNRNLRLFTLRHVAAPVYSETEQNPWHFGTPSGLLRKITGSAVRVTSYTPLGWPACWLALALGVAMLLPRLPSRALITPILLSALFYGFGYLVLSVASDLRYQLWTMMATLVATVLAWDDIRAGANVSRRQLRFAALPLIVVTAAAIGWRVLALVLKL